MTNCLTEGAPIAWARSCVSFSLNAAAAPAAHVDLETATTLAERAFATWEGADCGGGRTPSFKAGNPFGTNLCARHEYNATQPNANVIFFRESDWTYMGAANILAYTSVTYDAESGEILDADMEINATLGLSTTDSLLVGNYDLQSIMTHEAGHFLGLDHSRAPDAVMTLTLGVVDIRRRLTADDAAGICAVYPPDREAPACNYAPANGFSPLCALDPATGGSCSVTGPVGAPSGTASLGGLVALAWTAARRRSRRRAAER